MTPVETPQLRLSVDARALVAKNLACSEEQSVAAYLDALRHALAEEFPDWQLLVDTAAPPGVRLQSGDPEAHARLELRALAIADAVKRCIPWPVYE
ncbi:MAG: hypothetical protein GXP55_02110 [Deltaproteobacteria bacterium]|nr:hypothetical protein [Deltaproteobacteria bacterium]